MSLMWLIKIILGIKIITYRLKMVELAPYNGLHKFSFAPVITMSKQLHKFKMGRRKMERRYKLFAHYHVRNITAFNKKCTI